MMPFMRRHPHHPDSSLLDATVAAFQPLSSEPLSREDAAEIIDNLGRFGAILQRWAIRRAARAAARGDEAEPCLLDTNTEVPHDGHGLPAQ